MPSIDHLLGLPSAVVSNYRIVQVAPENGDDWHPFHVQKRRMFLWLFERWDTLDKKRDVAAARNAVAQLEAADRYRDFEPVIIPNRQPE